MLEAGGGEKPDTAQVPAGCPALSKGTWGIPASSLRNSPLPTKVSFPGSCCLFCCSLYAPKTYLLSGST